MKWTLLALCMVIGTCSSARAYAQALTGAITGRVLDSNGQVEYFTRLDNPTLKLTYQVSQNNNSGVNFNSWSSTT